MRSPKQIKIQHLALHGKPLNLLASDCQEAQEGEKKRGRRDNKKLETMKMHPEQENCMTAHRENFLNKAS